MSKFNFNETLFEFKIAGWTCNVTVRPCHINVGPHTSFDVHYLVNRVGAVRVPSTLDTNTMTLTQVKAVIKRWVKPDSLVACPKCGGPSWNRKLYPSEYRDDNCEACWGEAFAVKCAAEDAVYAKAEAKRDAVSKAKGFTHKTIAWVHPSRGGDDYQLVFTSKGQMSKTEIESLLRRRGSRIVTDYTQRPL